MKCFRLSGFDYSRPFFYLVTLKKLPGLQPFCSIVAPGKVAPTPITAAFEETIRAFAAKWRAVEKIWPSVVMPDHLHLIFKLGVSDKPITLPKLVAVLQRELSRAYWGALGMAAGAFGMAETAERSETAEGRAAVSKTVASAGMEGFVSDSAAISKTGAVAGMEDSTFDSAAISKTGAVAGKEGAA